jgi:hypothetical protein
MVTYKEKVGAYQRVFSGEDGKIVLDDLMSFCGVDRPSFDVIIELRCFFRIIKVWQFYYLRLVSVHLLQVQVTLSHCVRTIPLLLVN